MFASHSLESLVLIFLYLWYDISISSSPSFFAQSSGLPQYELQAVVLHHGKKATGGHYSAFTLDTQGPATAVAAAATVVAGK